VNQIQRVAAYNVCVDDAQRLLLVRLSERTEAAGSWTLPGGGIDFGEHPEAAAIRELHEETGLDGRIIELLAVDSGHRIAADHEYHAVRIIYRTEIIGGTLTDETDESTDAAAWFTRAELAGVSLVSSGVMGAQLAFPEAPF
jgi:ADP-ribose pyrophosphatase YjhB (NUDIX family)